VIIEHAIAVDADTAGRAAAALTAHLRRDGSFDVALAALVVDLSAVALGNGSASPSSPPSSEALTIEEYSRLSGLKPGACRRRAREGRVPAVKERGKWRISPQPNEPPSR
jgi:hypothetical protein